MSAELIATEDQASMPELPKIGYSIKEAEKITGVGRTTLWHAVNDGRLKYFKIGRRVLFSLEHLNEFMNSCERSKK